MKNDSNIALDKHDESCASNSGTFNVASQVQLHSAGSVWKIYIAFLGTQKPSLMGRGLLAKEIIPR